MRNDYIRELIGTCVRIRGPDSDLWLAVGGNESWEIWHDPAGKFVYIQQVTEQEVIRVLELFCIR